MLAFGTALDLRCLKVYEQDVVKNSEEDWIQLASHSKPDIDSAFRSLMCGMIYPQEC